MKPSACGLAVLLLPGLALAQGAYDEGRPARARLSLVPDAEHSVALLSLEGAVGATPTGGADGNRSTAARRIRGVSLSPHLRGEIVTLDLVASEDLSHSAVARAPMPDAHANLEGEAFLLCRLLAPGEAVSVTVSFIPSVAPQRSLLVWRGVTLDPLRAQGRVFVRGPGHSWTPGAERPDGPDLGRPPGPPGLEPTGSRATLRVHLTRWTPWTGGKKAGEVLLNERAMAFEGALFSAVTGGEQGSPLKVTPAAFGLAAAKAKAEVRGEADAVRLKDDRWVLGRAGRWWIVGAEGDVTKGGGEIFPFALDLAREGRAGFLWYGYGSHPKLAQDLCEQGFSTAGAGKAQAVEVTEASLVPFLTLLETHHSRLTRSGIERKD